MALLLKKISPIFALILLCGCVKTPQKNSNSFEFLFFSPAIKINEVGFLHKTQNLLSLQIYTSGINTLNIKIYEDRICTNQACFTKSEFNRKFLANEHYDDIFAEILEKKPIYQGENLEQISCGFKQDISKYSIKYEVCGKSMSFNDTKNRIKIITKELE